MRSITFGPTSYFESRLQRTSSEDQVDTAENIIQMERANSITNQNLQSHQPSLRMTEVIFYATENLFRESFVGHRELAMKKYCKCRFSFDGSRTFQSYCYEFCGLLNIHLSDLRFYLGLREVALSRLVRKPCVIEVQHAASSSSNQNKQGMNSLQPALKELFEKGAHSDIQIIINGSTEVLKAHKCILMSRSEKFKAMIESNMKENHEGKVYINDPSVKPNIYKYLLQWIYEGECDLPSNNINEIIILLRLTDEYLLMDLQKVCEDHIIEYMDGFSALNILTDAELILPPHCEDIIKDAAKQILLDEYEAVEKQIPEIEERISKVKGLMSDLFTFKKKKGCGVSGSQVKHRKGSIIGDDGQKKKVRFNISSTIYEEASAIHDESDSLIEPLSIYSNNSPPGELNDDIMVSSTHSSVHERQIQSNPSLHTSEQRRNNIVQFNDEVSDQIRNTHIDGNRFLRPASAGRNDGTHGNYRRNSTTGFDLNAQDENRQGVTQHTNNSAIRNNRSSLI